MDDLSTLRRSFRTHRFRLCPTRGSTPGWYAAPRWGTPKAVSPTPRSPPKNRSGAVSGRSEPWRRTPQPLAHSAKVHPPQSLLSEQRPDAAEPTKTAAERCRAGASLGGEHPTPSRVARKIVLPRAYSASEGLMPRSPAMRRSFRTHRFRLCLTRGSTPGWYAAPRWGTPKAVSPTPRSPPKPQRSGVGPERALEANTQPPRA